MVIRWVDNIRLYPNIPKSIESVLVKKLKGKIINRKTRKAMGEAMGKDYIERYKKCAFKILVMPFDKSRNYGKSSETLYTTLAGMKYINTSMAKSSNGLFSYKGTFRLDFNELTDMESWKIDILSKGTKKIPPSDRIAMWVAEKRSNGYWEERADSSDKSEKQIAWAIIGAMKKGRALGGGFMGFDRLIDNKKQAGMMFDSCTGKAFTKFKNSISRIISRTINTT